MRIDVAVRLSCVGRSRIDDTRKHGRRRDDGLARRYQRTVERRRVHESDGRQRRFLFFGGKTEYWRNDPTRSNSWSSIRKNQSTTNGAGLIGRMAVAFYESKSHTTPSLLAHGYERRDTFPQRSNAKHVSVLQIVPVVVDFGRSALRRTAVGSVRTAALFRNSNRSNNLLRRRKFGMV